ncbi:hypothetical protein D3C76_929520 [compost metagenome]
MRPGKAGALLVAVTGLTGAGDAVEHRIFQLTVTKGSVGASSIDRPLIAQAVGDVKVGLKSLAGLVASGVGS